MFGQRERIAPKEAEMAPNPQAMDESEAGGAGLLGSEPGGTDELGPEASTDMLGSEPGGTDELGPEVGGTDELGAEPGGTDILRPEPEG
jgi:hypothetical protein